MVSGSIVKVQWMYDGQDCLAPPSMTILSETFIWLLLYVI